jgi:hypothetical protein
MSQLVVDSTIAIPGAAPVVELPLRDVEEVEQLRAPRRRLHCDKIRGPAPQPKEPEAGPERAEVDPSSALRRECETIARTLANAADLGDRLDVYKASGIGKLSRAAALCPELMPILNGEFEWIALTMADVD